MSSEVVKDDDKINDANSDDGKRRVSQQNKQVETTLSYVK